MLLVRLLSFLRGYVTVRISGRSPQRLINICVARGIFLWNIRTIGDEVHACMSIQGFKRMPPIARKSACRVGIVRRHGLPFLLHRHRKRYVFAGGVVAFLILCHVLSLFVWRIEITGSQDIDKARLMRLLSRYGLKTGVYADSVDSERIRRGVMTEMEEIGWISVMVNGSGAEVEVRKRVPKPDIVDESRACNLVASHNGVITEMNISEGVEYVKKGDVVYKGQLLVSGVIESRQMDVRTVPASGIIRATTWHEKTAIIPTTKTVRTRTGKTKSKHTLEMFGWNMPLFFSDKVSFDEFDRESHVNKLIKIGKLYLPFSFHYDKFYDVEISTVKISQDEGIALLKEQISKEIKSQLSADAVIENITWEKGTDAKGRPTLTGIYQCNENIAQEKEALYEPYGENNGSGANGGDN